MPQYVGTSIFCIAACALVCGHVHILCATSARPGVWMCSDNGAVLESVVRALEQRVRRGIDSGKGVRIQGGRVYDSKHGITCHW